MRALTRAERNLIAVRIAIELGSYATAVRIARHLFRNI